MDWYSWLSKSALDPSLVSEYAFLLSRNELEEADIPHFDHEFLQSMGISIAKHRLEILKLANKHSTPRPVARLLAAIRKTKNCLAHCIHSLVHHNSSAIVVVPRAAPYGGGRWRGAVLKRSKRVVLLKQGRLMLTDGDGGSVPAAARRSPLSHSASPMVFNRPKSDGDGDDGFWKGGGGEEIRWDFMFQDLNPT